MAQVANSVQDLIGQAVGTEARKEDTDVLFYPRGDPSGLA